MIPPVQYAPRPRYPCGRPAPAR